MDSPINRKSFKKTASNLHTLDEDFYPDQWSDDQKMAVFLNTFRPRHVNPEHYDQKMDFWKQMIESYCDYKGTASVTADELKKVFRRKGTSPYCIHDVFNQMSNEGNLIDKGSFMQQPKSFASWAISSLVVRPLSWGLGKIKEKLVSNSENEQTVFVVKSAVKAQARVLLDHVRNRHSYNNIMSMEDLMANDIDGLSKDGILLVLQYLNVEEKKVYIEENISSEQSHHHRILMKFAEPHKISQPISEMERSIYNLENTEKFLQENIETKELHLNEVLKQVKDCLRDGKKQMAKTHLRKKHLIESDITKSMNILENVQTMLQRVHASKNDKDIINTYKMGSEAIKTAFAAKGINLDSVEDIIEDMREVLSDQEECQAVLSEPIRGIKYDDDEELEKELNDLMNMKDNNKPDCSGGEFAKDNFEDLNWLDKELEIRLRRLRSDNSDDPVTPQTNRTNQIHAGLRN